MSDILQLTSTHTYFREVISVASDNTCHKIVVSTQVLGSTVVDNVRAVLQGSLEVRAHHGVIHNDNGIFAFLLNHSTDPRNVDYFQERVRRGLQENHGSLARIQVRKDRRRVRGVDVMDSDAHVGAEVCQETVRAPVEVISCDDFAAGLEDAGDDVQRGHS